MNWIKQRRKELGISQEELAEKLQLLGVDVSRASIGHWETGHAKPPLEQPQFVAALSKAMNLDINTVLSRSGYSIVSKHTNTAERIASIVDELPEEKQELALRLVEQLAKT